MKRAAVMLATLIAATLLMLHAGFPHCVTGGPGRTLAGVINASDTPQNPDEPQLVHAFDVHQVARLDGKIREGLTVSLSNASRGTDHYLPPRSTSDDFPPRCLAVARKPDCSVLQVYRC